MVEPVMDAWDADLAAFVLMAASGKPVRQMWAELCRHTGRRPPGRRRRITWSDVQDVLADQLRLAALEAEPDFAPVLLIFNDTSRATR